MFVTCHIFFSSASADLQWHSTTTHSIGFALRVNDLMSWSRICLWWGWGLDWKRNSPPQTPGCWCHRVSFSRFLLMGVVWWCGWINAMIFLHFTRTRRDWSSELTNCQAYVKIGQWHWVDYGSAYLNIHGFTVSPFKNTFYDRPLLQFF